jgi:hypothetical protein
MMTDKKMDSYDEIKGMLNKIRKIQAQPRYGIIQEQTPTDPEDSRGPLTAPYGYGAGTKKPIPRSVGTEPQKVDTVDPSKAGDNDVAVINNVEVQIHSEDPEDLILQDDEKGQISQLIDDFKSEVSEVAEFDKLNLYPDSAKLDGRIGELGLNFTFSTGDDTGLYLTNTQMLKIDDNSLDAINKLRTFEAKFSNTINDLLSNRREN